MAGTLVTCAVSTDEGGTHLFPPMIATCIGMQASGSLGCFDEKDVPRGCNAYE